MACCNHQQCVKPYPNPSPTPFCCPNPSIHQFHTRPNYNTDLLPSLLRRINFLELSLIRPSPASPPPPTLRDFAARTIQSRFRASLLRRARAFREINDLASFQSSLHRLNSCLQIVKEMVDGMMRGRISDDPYKNMEEIRMRNEGNSRDSCAATELCGVCRRSDSLKQSCLDRDVNRLIDELNERVKRLHKVPEVLGDKDGGECLMCSRGGLNQEHEIHSKAEKRVLFQEEEDAARVCNFSEYSTTWVHNFDEYKKEPVTVSGPCDDGAIIVCIFDEYSATRAQNFGEFRKKPLSRPYDDDSKIYEYSASRIHDFDEYRGESLRKPSDNFTYTKDAVAQHHVDDGEEESDDEENVSEELDSDAIESNEEEDEENGNAESAEGSVVEHEENDFSQGIDGGLDEDDEDQASLEGDIEENPEESVEGSEGEDESDYESSGYEDRTENECCEDENETEDECCEDEDETEDEEDEVEFEIENGSNNEIQQDEKEAEDSAVKACADDAMFVQLAEQRTKHRHELLTNSGIYEHTGQMADEMNRRLRLKKVICHQCNKRGHIKRNCWYNPARRCNDCNMLGHTREVCTHFNDQQSQTAQDWHVY